MKKLALFVEGQTEQIFLTRLVREILGEKNVTIIQKKLVGGTNVPKQEFVRSTSFTHKAEYLVLINDCGSDNRVKTEILDNIETLRNSDYKLIVGLRDLYPLPIDELPRLEQGLRFLPHQFRHLHNPYDIVIAIQEVETWFLAETHHFARVDYLLTGPFINKYLGFNPFTIDPTSRKHPAKDLSDIYQLVGKSYTKKYYQVEKLVNRLDFDNIIRHLRHEITSLNKMISLIESIK